MKWHPKRKELSSRRLMPWVWTAPAQLLRGRAGHWQPGLEPWKPWAPARRSLVSSSGRASLPLASRHCQCPAASRLAVPGSFPTERAATLRPRRQPPAHSERPATGGIVPMPMPCHAHAHVHVHVHAHAQFAALAVLQSHSHSARPVLGPCKLADAGPFRHDLTALDGQPGRRRHGTHLAREGIP